jgi:hypothetical protein
MRRERRMRRSGDAREWLQEEEILLLLITARFAGVHLRTNGKVRHDERRQTRLGKPITRGVKDDQEQR